MLKIQKDQANNITCTLSEKTTIAPVYYYLEVTSNENNTSKAVYLGTDSSTATERYNKFSITEAATDDLDNSQINLPTGSYDYFAWECSAQSFTNKVSIVESGKLIVEGTTSAVSTFTNEPTEYTFKND